MSAALPSICCWRATLRIFVNGDAAPVDRLGRVVAETWQDDSLRQVRSMLEALKFGLIFAVPTIMAVATFIAAARADQRRYRA
jgi:hypothetical protein